MGYFEARRRLAENCESIRGFNKKTFEIIIADRKKASELMRLGEYVQGFYRASATAKTNFYKNNGGAYCELLSILAE